MTAPKRTKEKTRGLSVKKIHESRDLAHLDFSTQVFSTAILMAVSDHWEKAFGKADDPTSKKCILGNRLDILRTEEGELFPVGTYALYRFWGEDYSNFVKFTSDRFNEALVQLAQDRRLNLLSTDVASFYPSISLPELTKKINSTPSLNDLERSQIAGFFGSIETAMKGAGLSGLPQGMVAAGFFSNVYLHDFDSELLSTVTELPSLKQRDPKLLFYARYVDDIRLILDTKARKGQPPRKVEKHVVYKSVLRSLARHGLKFSAEKSTLLEQSSDGTALGEGLLAEKMENLAKKAYGSLAPETVDDSFWPTRTPLLNRQCI